MSQKNEQHFSRPLRQTARSTNRRAEARSNRQQTSRRGSLSKDTAAAGGSRGPGGANRPGQSGASRGRGGTAGQQDTSRRTKDDKVSGLTHSPVDHKSEDFTLANEIKVKSKNK